MEKRNPAEILSQLNELYEKREAEYQNWEENYQKKMASLDQMLKDIETRSNENQRKSKELSQKEEALQEREKKLVQREETLAEEYLKMEISRSDNIRLKQENADLLFEQAVGPQNPSDGTNQAGHNISQAEHEAVVSRLENTVKLLTITLLKNNIPLPEDMDAGEPDFGTQTDQGNPMGLETSGQDLTENTLREYLKSLEGVTIDHQDQAGRIDIRYRGLGYHFIFSEPPEFTVSVEKTVPVRKERIEKEFPGLLMETRDDHTDIKGFFTSDIAPGELVQRVFEIGNILFENEEEGAAV